MRIDEFEFRNKKGEEIEPTKAQLVFYIKSLHKDIKDLEAKLAEKDQAIENWETMYGSVMQTCKNDIKEIERLNKLLAEKEKELKYKTAECEKWKTDYKNCSELEKIRSKEHQYCLDNWRASEQDKISFAVEQLEKVKETFTWGKDNGYLTPENAVNIIDNQIKQLKKGK